MTNIIVNGWVVLGSFVAGGVFGGLVFGSIGYSIGYLVGKMLTRREITTNSSDV